MPGEAVFSTKVLDNNELKNSDIKLSEAPKTIPSGATFKDEY
jgi:hypothetical protein